MRRAIIPALLLVLLSVVLGATVFREQVAHAAANLNVFVTNDAAHPVPVHEQGTANVNVQGVPTVKVAEEPFQTVAHLCFTGSETTVNDSFDVPNGKRLTIDYVNTEDPFTQKLTELTVGGMGLPVIDQPNNPDLEVVSEQIRQVREAGSTVLVVAGRDSSPGANIIQCDAVYVVGTLTNS